MNFVITAFYKRVPWKYIWHLFMKELGLSNVNFVSTIFHIRVPWINTCQQFMEEQSHSNVVYVTKIFKDSWLDNACNYGEIICYIAMQCIHFLDIAWENVLQQQVSFLTTLFKTSWKSPMRQLNLLIFLIQ